MSNIYKQQECNPDRLNGSSRVDHEITDGVLERARSAALAAGIGYGGGVSALDALALFSSGLAVLVDVRTSEERKFVGYVPGSVNVPWMTGANLIRNPRFVRELESKAKKSDVILLLCRSGKRSAAAAETAFKAGFQNVFNVLEGFEGDMDGDQQRGQLNGWRHANLPWVQS